MESVPTLLVVPARAESAEAIEPLLQTLVSLTTTAPGAMVLVVDDASPAPQAALIEAAANELDCAYVVQRDGEGSSAAFNVGLSAASQHGLDVCLVAPGLTFAAPGWLDLLEARNGTDGRPAAVVGGAVVNPGGMIRHAGFFFSAFRRSWSARLRNTPEALLAVEKPVLCPVGSDLQLIRREWFDAVGFYDEQLDGPDAALDFCLRVSAAGGECILEPTVRGHSLVDLDVEPVNNGPGAHILASKHGDVDFRPWAPETL